MVARKQVIETIIGSDTTVEGSLNLKGSLIVYGNVRGDIKAEGVVRIAEGAEVEGNISASDTLVGGMVQGDINVKGKVILGSHSKLSGNLVASRLIIEEGARFEGKCDMQIERRAEGEMAELNFPEMDNAF